MSEGVPDPRGAVAALEYFPGIQGPVARDLFVVRNQIGREPRGTVLVAARCPEGRPAVIVTVPFVPEPGGGAAPLLWLSCPGASLKAARLESAGGVGAAARRLEEDGGSRARFLVEEEEFGRMLEKLATAVLGPEAGAIFENRGAAGGRPGSLKCLHAHIAHRLAAGRGVIGEWCLEELEGAGGTWCESLPKACVY